MLIIKCDSFEVSIELKPNGLFTELLKSTDLAGNMKKFYVINYAKMVPKSADHFCPPNSHMQTFSTNTQIFFNFTHDDDNQQYANVLSRLM